MAAIDKLYVHSPEELKEFLAWANENNDKCLKETGEDMLVYISRYEHQNRNFKNGSPIANFPLSIDEFLLKYCTIGFVLKYLEKQCGFIY